MVTVPPRAKYTEQLCHGGKKGSVSVSRLGLFWAFFKLICDIEGIRARTMATLVFDQLPNIYMFLILTLKHLHGRRRVQYARSRPQGTAFVAHARGHGAVGKRWIRAAHGDDARLGHRQTNFDIDGARAHLLADESFPEGHELQGEVSGKRASFRDAAGDHDRLRSSRGDEEEDASYGGDEDDEVEESGQSEDNLRLLSQFTLIEDLLAAHVSCS